MASQFRQMLEHFYKLVNQSHNSTAYLHTLRNELDLLEEEPIHIISIPQEEQEQISSFPKPITLRRPPDHIYRSYDFSQIFLFALFRMVLKNNDECLITNFQTKVTNCIIECFANEQNNECQMISALSEEVFRFLYDLKDKNYEDSIRDHVLCEFFKTTFVWRGQRRNQVQIYGNQSQVFLGFLFGLGPINSQKERRSFMNPSSNVYDENDLDFNLILQHWETREEWIIGEGQNEIKIIKTCNEYLIPKEKQSQRLQENELDVEWSELLNQSIQIRNNFNVSSDNLIEELNLEEIKSPRSIRSFKSASNYKTFTPKNKYDFI